MGKFKPDNQLYIPQKGEFVLREGRTLEATNYKPLSRVLLEISYDGSEYGGWQIQPNRLAVQEDMQNKLTKLYGVTLVDLDAATIHSEVLRRKLYGSTSTRDPDREIGRAHV